MHRIVYILLFFALVSCSTGRIASTSGTKPSETIVFGKLSIDSTRPLDNKKILMHFNDRLWGKHSVWLDESGYFYTKLPLGSNFLALIEYRDNIGFYKNLPENYISINLPAADKIYYIGDITIDWTPVNLTDTRRNGGVAGVLAEAEKKGEYLPVSIENSERTINFFHQKFPDNTKEVLTELVRIDE
ncbi:hypothetical protein [Pontibacter amylolyticus]|uniref:DUF4369 domain-containing protein n=1 Tax=Pontibacter amylolyticus TaxID=1424080 RepID=A0ABQ1W0Z6_9BACT|nr:hypothetical protein [Pontibacter amylolyticus]GGG09236.1 hypothetical protein GCM10011323_12200 [Pontibacter amylolyticus]